MTRSPSKVTRATLAGLALTSTVSAWAGGFPGGVGDALGPRFEAAPDRGQPPSIAPQPGLTALRRWNQIAVNATGLDHTPVGPGESRIFGEQFGPTRASRAMAIVHIAIFDAANAIAGG